MTGQRARCGDCGGVLVVGLDPRVIEDIAVLVGREIARQLAPFRRALGIIEQELRIDMSEIDDKLDTVESGVTAEEAVLATLSADETRELADLTELKNQPEGPELTPEQEARFDALTAKIAADTAAVQADDDAINAADPAPVVTPPADGGDTPPADGEPAAE